MCIFNYISILFLIVLILKLFNRRVSNIVVPIKCIFQKMHGLINIELIITFIKKKKKIL